MNIRPTENESSGAKLMVNEQCKMRFFTNIWYPLLSVLWNWRWFKSLHLPILIRLTLFFNLITSNTYDSPSLLITTTPTTPLWDWILLRVSSISFVDDCWNINMYFWLGQNKLNMVLSQLPFLEDKKSLPFQHLFLRSVLDRNFRAYISFLAI